MVYPNPANNSVQIEIPESIINCDLTIKNIIGQTKHHEKMTGLHSEVNVSAYEKGIYFVILSNEENKYIKKLIVN
jgi:aminopeptidase YwaD